MQPIAQKATSGVAMTEREIAFHLRALVASTGLPQDLDGSWRYEESEAESEVVRAMPWKTIRTMVPAPSSLTRKRVRRNWPIGAGDIELLRGLVHELHGYTEHPLAAFAEACFAPDLVLENKVSKLGPAIALAVRETKMHHQMLKHLGRPEHIVFLPPIATPAVSTWEIRFAYLREGVLDGVIAEYGPDAALVKLTRSTANIARDLALTCYVRARAYLVLEDALRARGFDVALGATVEPATFWPASCRDGGAPVVDGALGFLRYRARKLEHVAEKLGLPVRGPDQSLVGPKGPLAGKSRRCAMRLYRKHKRLTLKELRKKRAGAKKVANPSRDVRRLREGGLVRYLGPSTDGSHEYEVTKKGLSDAVGRALEQRDP